MSYDLAGDLFDHLLKNLENNSLSTINAPTTSWESVGSFRRFNQQEFVDDGLFGYAGLAEWGYLYYPDSCKSISKSCKVHMHLHGCFDIHQGLTKDYFKGYGFLQYAATNDIIILFP
jgi:poly(3-hydroxybutyrate) depolymerase